MITPITDGSKKDWKTILLTLFLSICAVLVFFIALALSLLGISAPSNSLSLLMLAAGTLTMAGLLIPGIILNIRKVLNQPELSFSLPPLDDRVLLPSITIVWIICLVIGQRVSDVPITSNLLLPILNIFGVSFPILFYLRISLRNLRLPNPLKGWSLFGASILVSPLLAFILEGILIGLIAIVFMVSANYQPGLQATFGKVFNYLINNIENQDEALHIMANILFSSGVGFSIFAIFCVAVPIIEEIAKIILIIPILKSIDRPINGYVLGIFCGAAFAFVENLGFTSSGSSDWVLNAMTRSTAALPHIFNSGMLGWALVAAWRDHKYWNLAKTFLAAILIHGTWNAVSLGFSISALYQSFDGVPAIFQSSFSWLAGWIMLTVGVFLGLIFINFEFYRCE